MIRCNEYCSVGRGVRAKRTPAGKVALVRHWQKVGLKGSSQLAIRRRRCLRLRVREAQPDHPDRCR